MSGALDKANEINTGQVRGHILTCLESVKLDLEELRQYSSSVVVNQAIELIEEQASKLNSAIAALTAAHCATDEDHRASILEDAMNDLAPLRPLQELLK